MFNIIKNIAIFVVVCTTTYYGLVLNKLNDNETEILTGFDDTSVQHIIDDLAVYNYYVTKGERALITIDSPGGNAFAMKRLLSVIDASKVKVDTYVPESAASAGAILFLYGDTRYVNPHAIITFHGVHLGTYALNQHTMSNAVDHLENGRMLDLLAFYLLNKRTPMDMTLEETKAFEVCLHFLRNSGLNGLHQTLKSFRDRAVIINNSLLDSVEKSINKHGQLYTREEIKKMFFADFKEDVIFTGQQLIDMGLAKRL